MNNELKISLDKIGRRFNREWIFRGVDYHFVSGESYAVLGPNGSGKSTLLQVVNGSLTPSEGKIDFSLNNQPLDIEQVYGQLSLAAPYLEVIEEFTLSEMIDFHFKFKPFLPGFDRQLIIDLLAMEKSRNKAVKYFSSGMKQRLKLALAFCSDTRILMLDEPTSNLDNQGITWYLSLVQKFATNRLLIICSNQEHEYSFCNHQLHITDYKK
ncbi:ABC transporter family protein [Mucilaginibacter yixingensis]|uniref:ABC transporter family protein n=1 Tax=Mucilaginibacter yixingensis TaxID=1295612 RepID=A0A2T5JDF8_9SPHI|nr:ATP-binding cassette domain-containing protein [Mucilaginibacter yixingensis]PTQ99799.1 ABC transporter family protein [Mucilaginibacter yixingensis]